MTDHDACITPNLTPGIGPARAALLIQSFGSAAAIFERSADELASVHGISGTLAEAILNNAGASLEKELELIERSNINVLTITDFGYPELLSQIEDPPVCLYVCGELPDGFALNLRNKASVRLP